MLTALNDCAGKGAFSIFAGGLLAGLPAEFFALQCAFRSATNERPEIDAIT